MNNHSTSPRTRGRLDLLYRLSQTFNSSLDLDEVLNRVMDEVIAAMKAERGFVMLLDENSRLVFKVARGIDQHTIDDPQFQVSLSIVERVALEGQPILTSDARSDARFSMRQSVMLLGLRSILCVPLILKDKTLGVIYVDNHLQSGIFSVSDQDLLTAIASNASIAIENARLYLLAVEKGRLERELQMARQVQVSLLPDAAPQVPGWEFAATWQPARQVAGDYYDFIPFEDGRVGLVIADVTDKGMPAALFMAMTRTVIRASVTSAASPAEGISKANQLICADSTDGMFVTLFYAQIDPQSAQVTYVNAGHDPPMFYHLHANTQQGQLAMLERTGMVLGILKDTPFTQNKVKLSPGDFILLYTDGITDAHNAQRQFFGIDKIQSLITQHQHQPAQVVLSTLIQSVGDFTGETDPFDDITVAMIRRLPVGE
jgi:sigma-B regulation protein RsbU (phosphoserine phosphatase)